MSFPVAQGFVATIGGVDTATHTFNVPSGVVAGERLFLFVSSYDQIGLTSMPAPAGWTETLESFIETNIRLTCFEKTSDGTETTATITSGRDSSISFGHCYRVSGWESTEYSSPAQQPVSASIDSVTAPTLTPSWSGDTLYMVLGSAGRDSKTFGTMPAGYTSQTGVSGNNAGNRGVGLGSGYKQAASAAESPGDLVASTYLSMIAVTIAIKPASASVTTSDTLQPGESFTLTATNYTSAPVSPATLTDSEGSTITVPVTISGSGPYTAVGTMPTLAEAVTAGTSLLFGDVTIELST